jgi:hypothetical protein
MFMRLSFQMTLRRSLRLLFRRSGRLLFRRSGRLLFRLSCQLLLLTTVDTTVETTVDRKVVSYDSCQLSAVMSTRVDKIVGLMVKRTQVTDASSIDTQRRHKLVVMGALEAYSTTNAYCGDARKFANAFKDFGVYVTIVTALSIPAPPPRSSLIKTPPNQGNQLPIPAQGFLAVELSNFPPASLSCL